MANERLTATPGQYLMFRVAGDDYAVPILKVREIIGLPPITKVPNTSPVVRGIINLRGSVVPVIDLCRKFSMPESPAGKRTCVLIVEVGQGEQKQVLGAMVDAVSHVLDLAAGDLRGAPTLGARVQLDYLQGLGRSGDRFVPLLDVERTLSADDVQEVVAAVERSGPTPTAEGSTGGANAP